MAGDHGVAAEGVSKYPQEVTPQMVYGFVGGMAGINALARLAGARVVVVDMGVAADLSALAKAGKIIDKKIALGTANIAVGPAMTREQAVRADRGRHRGRRGAGRLGRRLRHRRHGHRQHHALDRHRRRADRTAGRRGDRPRHRHRRRATGPQDRRGREGPGGEPARSRATRLDVLAKVGGFEIGGIAGVVLGAAARRKPVVVDGFISTAGALMAHALCPAAADYIIAAHRSVEQGHRAMHARSGQGAAAGPGPAPGRRDRRGAGHEPGRSGPADPDRGGHVRRGPRFEGRTHEITCWRQSDS